MAIGRARYTAFLHYLLSIIFNSLFIRPRHCTDFRAELWIGIKNLFSIRDFNFSLNFCNISQWRSAQNEICIFSSKISSQTMPYYGTMEMSLHCCGTGGRWSGRGRVLASLQRLKGRPSDLIYCEDLWLRVFKWKLYTGPVIEARPFPRKVTNLWTRDTSAEVPALRSWNFKRRRWLCKCWIFDATLHILTFGRINAFKSWIR